MPVLNFDSDEERQRDLERRLDGEHVLAGPVPEGDPNLLPEGWKTFTVSLPPGLYARLLARAEAELSDLDTEAAYLIAYGLDNAPRPSETPLDPPDEQEEARQFDRLRAKIRDHFGRESTGG